MLKILILRMFFVMPTYHHDDYIRVSTVLEPFTNLKDVPADVLQNACDRGNKVHNTIRGILEDVGEYGVDDQTRPYIESFKQWYDADIFTPIHIERRFYDDDMMLTGQVDAIFENPRGQLLICDWKTSFKPSKTWQAQAGAYYHLVCKNLDITVSGVNFIHLDKNGGFPTVHEYPCDSGLFMSVWDVYQHFYAKKRKR